MRALLIVICLTVFSNTEVLAQTEFELDTQQSMIMTGKGPGQDGTINPYAGEDCYAIVENIGERSFSIRIQTKGKIVEEIAIEKGDTKKLKLLKGYELYLDPNPEGKAKARVDYERMN